MSEVRKKHNHYHKPVDHLQFVDVYRVLQLFNVTDPCIQHAVKKLLVAGGRGAGKDVTKDIQEAIDSLVRWQEMQAEDANAAKVFEAPVYVSGQAHFGPGEREIPPCGCIFTCQGVSGGIEGAYLCQGLKGKS